MKKRLFISTFLTLFFCFFVGITAQAATNEEQDWPYVIMEGSIYYESSDGFGSGKSAIVASQNPYTSIPCEAGIDGYSFLDVNGHILQSDYQPYSNIVVPAYPNDTYEVFLHFYTPSYRNGWTHSDNVFHPFIDVYQEDVEKPEEVIEQIDEIAQTGKTAIVVDYSGSMSDNQKQVVQKLGELDFSKDISIFVFGDTYQKVTHQELMDKNFKVGSSTHMYAALNAATAEEVENLVIISDLGTYEDVPLVEADSLKSITIYNPDFYFEFDFVLTDFSTIWPQAKIIKKSI